MNRRIQSICVMGSGSAGCLAALTMRRLLNVPELIVVRSPSLPVIGVGESTTAFLPIFLHRQLALNQNRFYAEVRPSWKLGIRFEWGPSEISHFNYPFGFEYSERSGPLRKRAGFFCLEYSGVPGPVSALMDQSRSPCLRDPQGRHGLMRQPYGYHIPNNRFLAYLETLSREYGVKFVDGIVRGTERWESGDVKALLLDNASRIEADLFVDCSGFRSSLLHEELHEPFVSYDDALFCDTALTGSFERSGLILPYTTVTTMKHGWCWRIELPDRVTIGYVHSSQFCSNEEAKQELRTFCPELGEDLRVIQFPSGRYENFWSHNVVAIGNASGFVEPLESTALHVICDQLASICGALLETDLCILPAARTVENRRFRKQWDAIRDFLAVHYKFNHRLDTPFWQHCYHETHLGEAEAIVDLYQRLGPYQACRQLIPQDTVVQFEGYLSLLIGQRVPTQFHSQFDAQDLKDWSQWQQSIQNQVKYAIPVREALRIVSSPNWKWS